MKVNKDQLLQRKDVLEEINRHLWLESEKAGHDIGFAKAAEDWVTKFSEAWISYHLPKEKGNGQRAAAKKGNGSRGRTAKSYR
jgi:hypothetical protein